MHIHEQGHCCQVRCGRIDSEIGPQGLHALLKGAGDWEGVLELDETDEEAHRALMQAQLDANNRREAIRQFERLRDALREHIGVGPDSATVALYEKVLALEGPEAPSAAERTAALLANGLVAWNRRDLTEAERLAREARSLALSAELGHELGEASTLLALIAFARGMWHELFREEFADSVGRGADLEMAVYDAHLCFQEFYLYGPEATPVPPPSRASYSISRQRRDRGEARHWRRSFSASSNCSRATFTERLTP